MNKPTRNRPSPSLVLSVITLFVALTSTAGALPGSHVVRRGDIAKGAVTTKALAKGAVKRRAIARGAVTSGKLANDSVTSRSLAPASVGAFALGDTQVVSGSIPDADSAVDFNWTRSPTGEAVCTPGTVLVGGGVAISASGSARAFVQTSAPSSTNDRWLGTISTDTGGATPGHVYAVCLL
jgi:hypothetical protein